MKFNLREWMDLRNVSQSQVAAGVGVTRSTVNAWLEGRIRDGKRIPVYPDYESLEALCLFLECSPNDLLEITRRQTPSDLTWRDFSGKRGPGRPPRIEEPH